MGIVEFGRQMDGGFFALLNLFRLQVLGPSERTCRSKVRLYIHDVST